MMMSRRSVGIPVRGLFTRCIIQKSLASVTRIQPTVYPTEENIHPPYCCHEICTRVFLLGSPPTRQGFASYGNDKYSTFSHWKFRGGFLRRLIFVFFLFFFAVWRSTLYTKNGKYLIYLSALSRCNEIHHLHLDEWRYHNRNKAEIRSSLGRKAIDTLVLRSLIPSWRGSIEFDWSMTRPYTLCTGQGAG